MDFGISSYSARYQFKKNLHIGHDFYLERTQNYLICRFNQMFIPKPKRQKCVANILKFNEKMICTDKFNMFNEDKL